MAEKEDQNEFTAYGKVMNSVEKLVNEDIGADKFFESLSDGSFVVEYMEKIEDFFESKFSPEKLKIIPTTIQLRDLGDDNFRSTHSIILMWVNEKLYLYDPNGAYNVIDGVRGYQGGVFLSKFCYSFGNEKYTSTEKFQNFIKEEYKIDLIIPRSLGPQATMRLTEGETKYIGEGGYCMFFNYMIIDRIKNIRRAKIRNPYVNFPLIYDNIDIGTFPPPARPEEAYSGTAPSSSFEGKTKVIVNRIFGSGGRRKKTRRRRTSRRRSRRR